MELCSMFCGWNSVQYYVAAWMGGEFGGERIHVYVWLSPFTVHLRLSQHCQLAIPQCKEENNLCPPKNLYADVYNGFIS